MWLQSSAEEVSPSSPRHIANERALSAAVTILTTQAGEAVAPLHDRQPVIIAPEHLDRWLDPGITEREPLEELLHPVDDLVVEPD